MRIYTPEQCEKWVKYIPKHGFVNKVLCFTPWGADEDQWTEELYDISLPTYQHNQDRLKQVVNTVLNNYPQLESPNRNLHLYLCPKPSQRISNATTSGNDMVFWGRTTQIPGIMTDYIMSHELGHLVQYHFADSHGGEIFKIYLALRGASMIETEDGWEYECLVKPYDDIEWFHNPIEWFAEDFRYLFGAEKFKEWYFPIAAPEEEVEYFFKSLGQ